MTKPELTEAELDEISRDLPEPGEFSLPLERDAIKLVAEVRRLRGLLGQMREPLGLISEATPEQILLHTLDRIIDHREAHKAKVAMFLERDHQHKRAEVWRKAALAGEVVTFGEATGTDEVHRAVESQSGALEAARALDKNDEQH